MGYKSFVGLWHARCPEIKFMKQREDVCANCKQKRAECRVASSEEQRLGKLQQWTEHIELAQAERDFYNELTKKAKNAITSGEEPVTFIHLTFDFSENFVLPYHARQPGPVFSRVPYLVTFVEI